MATLDDPYGLHEVVRLERPGWARRLRKASGQAQQGVPLSPPFPDGVVSLDTARGFTAPLRRYLDIGMFLEQLADAYAFSPEAVGQPMAVAQKQEFFSRVHRMLELGVRIREHALFPQDADTWVLAHMVGLERSLTMLDALDAQSSATFPGCEGVRLIGDAVRYFAAVQEALQEILPPLRRSGVAQKAELPAGPALCQLPPKDRQRHEFAYYRKQLQACLDLYVQDGGLPKDQSGRICHDTQELIDVCGQILVRMQREPYGNMLLTGTLMRMRDTLMQVLGQTGRDPLSLCRSEAFRRAVAQDARRVEGLLDTKAYPLLPVHDRTVHWPASWCAPEADEAREHMRAVNGRAMMEPVMLLKHAGQALGPVARYAWGDGSGEPPVGQVQALIGALSACEGNQRLTCAQRAYSDALLDHRDRLTGELLRMQEERSGGYRPTAALREIMRDIGDALEQWHALQECVRRR